MLVAALVSKISIGNADAFFVWYLEGLSGEKVDHKIIK